MLPKISIHRLYWENHRKNLMNPAEAETPGAGEDLAKLRAKVAAEYKAEPAQTGGKLTQTKAEPAQTGAKLAQTEAELAKVRADRSKAEEATKGKDTSKATISKLKNQLAEWKAAPAWMIAAAIAVAQDGPKARSRKELGQFAKDAGGQVEGAYFEVWRAALPDDLCDKNDRSSLSRNNDETFEK